MPAGDRNGSGSYFLFCRYLPGGAQDRELRLVFIACHRCCPRAARFALTRRVVGRLTIEEIPASSWCRQSLRRSVLSVVCLILNEGCAVTCGDDWMRPDKPGAT